MAVVNKRVMTREMVSKVEHKLRIDGNASDAGDRCKGKCGVQESSVVPLDSSLWG